MCGKYGKRPLADKGPVVTADGRGCPTDVYSKRYFVRRTGVEAMGIRQAWRVGGSSRIVQRQVMSGYGVETSETGNDQMSVGLHGDRMQNRYDWMEGGETQVSG